MLTLLIVGWLAVQAAAAPTPIETRHLTLTPSAERMAAGRVALHVDVVPLPKMHVYAPGQRGYIAIALTLASDAPVKASGKPKYPAGEKIFMPVLNETQLVYGKPFRITQHVTLPPSVGSGPVTIKGTVRYQACDDTICYKPNTVSVSWVI